MSMKRLKKIAVMTLCVLICLFGSSVVCSAAQQRYTISELDDMVVFLPENMTAITRSSSATDKYFSVFGLDYDTTMQNFENGNIYLQGMDNMSGVTVTVTMTKTTESEGIGNYNMLSTEKLSEVTNNFLSQSEYTSCTPDNANDVVWLIFNADVNNNGTMIKAYQANTIYDGMSINVTLQRNGGNVTAEDYSTFSSIVSSATFLKAESANLVPYIIIGAGVLTIIVIIILIVILKYAKKRMKKNKNDKLIEELADKYTTRRNHSAEYKNSDYEDIEIVSQNSFEEDGDFLSGVESEEVKEYRPKPVNRAVESEIDEILGYTEKADEEFAKEAFEKPEKVNVAEAPVEEKTAVESDLQQEETESENIADFSDFEDEDEEYYNDEELVRQQSKRTKFVDSDDFFEEAPKKTMGVISSKEIRDAEDYDVINEVEKRVSEVEKTTPTVGEKVVKVLKNIGGGLKSFGIHFGYFCTNVSRMIKRKNAQKKRQRAEEERRERARLRAARERQQRREMQNGGLVQVRSRNDRRPSQNRRSGNSTRRR